MLTRSLEEALRLDTRGIKEDFVSTIDRLKAGGGDPGVYIWQTRSRSCLSAPLLFVLWRRLLRSLLEGRSTCQRGRTGRAPRHECFLIEPHASRMYAVSPKGPLVANMLKTHKQDFIL